MQFLAAEVAQLLEAKVSASKANCVSRFVSGSRGGAPGRHAGRGGGAGGARRRTVPEDPPRARAARHASARRLPARARPAGAMIASTDRRGQEVWGRATGGGEAAPPGGTLFP